eukprot:TRINITY_DN65014_c0_g1_i1.p1 TRINITY_DN65014_c0_g1~~TRINITY_DN65014_c0_g1_i1.p1  ORF type:complete len:175 (+),score=25.00 TRINITY_DN65014_c0_g1_i1:80-604(+)
MIHFLPLATFLARAYAYDGSDDQFSIEEWLGIFGAALGGLLVVSCITVYLCSLWQRPTATTNVVQGVADSLAAGKEQVETTKEELSEEALYAPWAKDADIVECIGESVLPVVADRTGNQSQRVKVASSPDLLPMDHELLKESDEQSHMEALNPEESADCAARCTRHCGASPFCD